MTKPLYVTPLRHTTRQAQSTMTDHRTAAEQLIDAADPTSPHTRDRTLTDAALVRAVLAVADAIDAHGAREHVIDHAVLQQNLDRARAAFPGTYTPTPPEQRLCMGEGRTPRGNRVVCSERAGHTGHHIAGGYWWDDDGSSGSTLPPVATSPRVCERRWSEMSGAHHECVLRAEHWEDRHQCECGAGCYDDDDEGSSVCPADGCGRPDGHDGDHRAAEPLTLPTLTVKRGGLRYHAVLHTSEGGDTSALAADVPDGSHEHGRAPEHEHLLVNPPTERLGTLVDSAARWARVTAGSGLSNVLTACVDAINDLHRQTVEQHNTIVSGHTSGDTIVPATQPANGTEDPLWRLRLLAGTARRAVTGGPLPAVITLHDLVQDIAVHLGHLIEQSGELQASVSGQRVLMDSYERQIRALAQQNGQLRDQRDRESEIRLAAQQNAVDPDLHEKLRRIDNVLRGALDAERAPSTLPFIDLVTDLGLRADAVAEDLTSERESRATVFETAKTLSQAIVHTVEYVGNDTLPAVEGWSWYDALREFWPDAANRFLTNPVRPKAQQ